MNAEIEVLVEMHEEVLGPLAWAGMMLEFTWCLVMAAIHSLVVWLQGILSRSFSITFHVSSVIIGFVVLIVFIWAFVRYRFLTKYSRLPLDQDDDLNAADIWLDDDDGSLPSKPSYTTYFDEFLNAIQVFGYLDRKVFHELTRHMRTHRIDAAESIRLKDLDGFAMVIEGSVEVYAKNQSTKDEDDYQLLTEVNRAAPISSLFSILALFTEEVKLNDALSKPNPLATEEVPELDLSGSATPPEIMSTDFEEFNNDVIAVGKTSTTIAVIPSEAFRLLTRKYPAHTANIVQIILLRWSRVTMKTSQNYLDLTWEIFETEKLLNQAVRRQLPAWHRDSAVNRLTALAQNDPTQKVFSLKHAGSGPMTPVPNYGSRHLTLDYHIDDKFPGDLLSHVPLSRNENTQGTIAKELASFGAYSRKASTIGMASSIFDKSRRVSTSDESDKLTFRRQGSILFSPEVLQQSQFELESEDGALRRALTEEMFSVLGFDSTMVSIAPSSREGSVILSAPNSPFTLPQFSLSMNRNSFYNDRQSDSPSIDGDASMYQSPSYETILDEAAGYIEIMLFKEGEILSQESSRSPGIFYVLDGTLSLEHVSGGVNHKLYDVNPGGIAGYIETVASYNSFVSIKAKTDAFVAKIPKEKFEKLADCYPYLYISVAKTMLGMLSRPIIHLDYALEWLNIPSGETLYKEGQEADAIYFVLNGRVRLFKEDEKHGKQESADEFGQGSSLGQLEVLLGDNYSNSAVAVRETELARFPKILVESLPQIFPESTFKMARIVASEVLSRLNPKTKNPTGNVRTVSILPTVDGLPVSEFAIKLAAAFRANGRDIVVLSNATVLSYLGRHAFSRIGILKLKGHLADLEQQYETIIYVADTGTKSQWTRTCVDQADCILLLADAAAIPTFGDYEKLLVKSRSSARANLVLLHQNEHVVPGSTARWLKNRPWVVGHHHVRMAFKTKESPNPPPKGRLNRLKQLRNRVQVEIFQRDKARKTANAPDHNKYQFKNDFNRIARILSGEAVGLVLGGGGARGIAQIGVLRALEEAGIPIDIVGGTSIGSFIGGLYAREYDMVPIYGRAKKFSSRLASIWRMVLDITYPTTSYTTGHEFNRGIWKTFGDSRIEDFWLRYFNNTTNLTHSKMDIHESGYAWRYIRASMSLAGLVPPIEDKGQMLLDGGYMDNLPVTEMLRRGAKYVIAVDVGSVDDTTPLQYGDTLSGLWVLFNRWNPFSTLPQVPNLAEIQARLAYVSSVKALDEAKVTPGVIYLRPPIEGYATLEFSKFDEILNVGYEYATQQIPILNAEGRLPNVYGDKHHKAPRPVRFRRHSI